jgi:tetratricopeptide (TPR) repeat protein/tRNA A-37 threonylcarbamoyl transferase component Bud32
MEIETRIDGLVGRWEELWEGGSPVTVEELCADCPELAAQVRRRIEVLRRMNSALDTEVSQEQSTAGDRDGLPEVLHATAVYRPRRNHDRGGLGVVCTAFQEELDRTVALKRIRPDKLHAVARLRFLREAALTARLQHPGIVPIYGLGQDDGGPFYTMPFIRGQTLKEAIAEFHGDESLQRDFGRRRLRFRGLLQHFVTACNTVAYAHDQGVVHRDLKPSNLMLGPYGETLVMDWGLAKRLGGDDAANEGEEDAPSPDPFSQDITVTGEVVGTPQYMSPEQARGEPAGPAGDIFSLGLVLYTILTGRSAFEETSFRAVDQLKAVREARIVPPRRREPGLPRGLEAVCLKALAARAEDRYPSARALADDVMRWLADEPVTAWREPASIRARRWARRHRTTVAAAVVALAAGVIGLGVVAAVQARANDQLTKAGAETAKALATARAAQSKTRRALAESEEARKQADATSAFLVDAFRRPDPSQDGRQVKVVDLLDRAGERVDKEFAGSQATRGALLDALGRTYLGLGLYNKAVSLLTQARTVREAVLGPDHPDALKGCNQLARAYFFAGRVSEASMLIEVTVKRQESALGPDHLDTLASRNGLALTYRAAGRLSDAIKLFEETRTRMERVLGLDHPATLNCRSNLANVYREAGRLSDAITLIEATLRLRRNKLDPEALRNRSDLAAAYREAGRTNEAIKLHQDTLALKEDKLGPSHPDTLASRNNLAVAYQQAGRMDKAIKLFEPTLEQRESVLGLDHPDTLQSRINLAAAYREAGRTDEAIRVYQEALERTEAKLGADHPDTLEIRNGLAGAYKEAGRPVEAITLHQRTLDLRTSRLGPDHPDTLRSSHNLAVAYRQAGRTVEAITLHQQTVRRMAASMGPDHHDTLEGRSALASAYQSLGRWSEAERLLGEVLERRRNTVPRRNPLLAGDLAALARNLLEQSRWSEAEHLVRESQAIYQERTPDDWRRYDAMSLLGGVLLGECQYIDAEPLIVAGYEGMKARAGRMTVPEQIRLREAAERVIRLFEASGRLARAVAWKVRLGMPDLPADIFAAP